MSDLTISSGKKIGFTANSTETTAKADTTSARMHICKTKQMYLNGQRLGLSDDEALYLKDNATDYSVTAASIAISAKSGYLAEVDGTSLIGTPAALGNGGALSSLTMFGGSASSSEVRPAIQVSGTLTNPAGLLVASTTYTMSVRNALGSADGSYTQSDFDINTSTGLITFPAVARTTMYEKGAKCTVTCTVTFSNGKTKAATFVFYIIPPIYTGVVDSEPAASSFNNTDFTTYGLTSQIQLSAKRSYTLAPTAAKPYPVLLIPTACTLGNNWTMAGYGMSVNKNSIKDIKGQGYYLISYGKQSASTQTITNS